MRAGARDSAVRGPRIVLARPLYGGNIGFVVRLLGNFGLEDLVLVDPAPDWRAQAEITASMCRGLFEGVRVAASLAEALAGTTHVFGFSARGGRDRNLRALQDLGEDARTLPAGARPAFLFGNEESGLSNEEARFCRRLYTFRAPGPHASLNLSHAVALALYEWHRAELPRPRPARNRPRLIGVAEKERLAARIKEVFTATRFRVDVPHLDQALNRLLHGSEIQSRDARVVHKALTYMTWLAKQAGIWGERGRARSDIQPGARDEEEGPC